MLWLIASAFRSSSETFASSSPLSWHVLWPKDFTLDNLRSAVDTGFLRSLGNSLLVAAVTVIVGLTISALAAFALAVIPFRGRTMVFSIVVLSFLVPFEAIAVPLSRSFSTWGLTNTLAALILPGLGNGLAVFTLQQFFRAYPPHCPRPPISTVPAGGGSSGEHALPENSQTDSDQPRALSSLRRVVPPAATTPPSTAGPSGPARSGKPTGCRCMNEGHHSLRMPRTDAFN